MGQVNFIKHLIAFQHREKPSGFGSKHYVLYMNLFHIWNLTKFQSEFSIFRSELMKQAFIGSRTTYQKCLKELHKWKYITYYPSSNPNLASKVKIRRFKEALEDQYTESTEMGQALGQAYDKSGPATVPSLGPYINTNKPYKTLNKKSFIKKIEDYFKENGIPTTEAQLFYHYYQAAGWKRGNQEIEDWEAAAKFWILKFQKDNANRPGWNLHINEDKDYSIPL